jgi:hypothetical protein
VCELRKEIMATVRDCVRLEAGPPDPPDRRVRAVIRLVLIDPRTRERTVLGEPVEILRPEE